MRLAAWTLAGLLLVAAAGCGSDEHPGRDDLAGLKADPLATATIPGAAQVDAREESARPTSGEPVHAQYTRYFRTRSGKISARVLAAAAAEARKAGWRITPLPGGYSGTKQVGGSPAVLSIYAVRTRHPPRLALDLRSLN